MNTHTTNKSPASPKHFVCPACDGNGGLLQGCKKTSYGYGEPCNDGLKCRNYMGVSNICVPANIGTKGNTCVPGYGDLSTCYDDSECIKGMCREKKLVPTGNIKNINTWIIAAIVCIIILLIILLTIGLASKGKSKK